MDSRGDGSCSARVQQARVLHQVTPPQRSLYDSHEDMLVVTLASPKYSLVSVSVSVSVRSSSDSVAVSPSVTAGVGASVEAMEEVDACLLWVASELASDDLRPERGCMGERAARGLRWPYVRSMSATNTW